MSHAIKPILRRLARQARLQSLMLLLALVLSATSSIGSPISAPSALALAVPGATISLPPSTQFDMTGFLQAATLGGPGTGPGTGAHAGGTLTVNNHLVIVPSETIVILPANALTWQELFAQAPAPYGLSATPPSTGMAMADVPKPLSTYEVQVVGNRVGDTYIAGLVYLSQQGLNSGVGYINFMDYTTGEMRVGGKIGSSTTGARVRINDPAGRYGRAMSPDPRFTVDPDNPTIAAATGFPMCFPRTDPTVANDPLCPQGNRPNDTTGNPSMIIQMNDPVALPSVFPDATKQAPFEVGDFVTYAGTLIADAAGTYISAHTVSNNVAIYTWPGTNPAYVATEVALMGTGGLTVLGAGEAAIRTRFEGMTTDPSRRIHLYGIDVDPITGAVTDRDWGIIGVDQGAPIGAVKGRWRFRPPCTATPDTVTDKACSATTGTFLPPPREMRAVIEGAWVPGQTTTYANGIIAGQYHAPILEYIFPENIPGTPVVENNFNTFQFLANGGYTSSAGTLVGQLNPWPSNVVPPAPLKAPVASAGGPYTVASGGTVTLAGSATGTAPLTYAWDAPITGTLSARNIANPVFTAPTVTTTTVITLSLTVTNSVGTSNSTTTVTVNAAVAPTVNPIASQTVYSGQPVAMTATGTDPNGLPLTFSWLQTVSTGPIVLATNPFTGPTVNFVAPLLPAGQVTPAVLNFAVTATNSAGVQSAPQLTSVTVKPLPDSVAITLVEYRIGKQRLIVNATSSVVSPNVVLTLQPYKTNTGTIFDPAMLGNTLTNVGGGGYTLTLVGAPEPDVSPGSTPLVVKSNLGGVSPPHGVDRLRQ